LIVLNDLLVASSVRLPDGSTLQPLSLFSVFPLGFALTALGILWFLLIGWLGRSNREDTTAQPERRVSEYVERVYGIKGELVEARIGRDSPLAGRRVRALEQDIIDAPFLLALYSGDVVKVPPDPEETLWVDSHLGLMGEPEAIARFCEAQDLDILEEPDRLAKVLDPQQSGIAEVVITPSSNLVGNAIGDIKPRRNFGMNILQIARRGEVKLRGFGDIVLQAGDTLLVHASWADLEKLRRTNSNMVVATDFRYEPMRVEQQRLALLVSAASLLLFFLTDNLPLSLMAGAISMILTNVVSMDEAYEAVSWSTIFLLASLIPLGLAVDRTGTAAWLSQVMLNAVGDVPSWVLQSLLAVLATVFSLLMSNVGATILLVPLAINVAIATGADPALFALTIGVATSNAFLIPTNQVNALIAGPGGYRVSDFLRVGGGMTVIFLVASLVLLNLLFS
jgi:di/tricarboxylate transporter